uniref:DUF2231 domain-containing protein n=1 Tax=Thermorudis sp. TaxID=1969470 RepID=A0A7C2WIZ8_9BACT
MNAIDRQRWLDRPGKVLRGAVGSALARGGLAGRWLKNALHGTWLGHPLHPVLTDVPLGAWTAVTVLDAAEVFSGRHRLRSGADAILGVGLAAAVGAAASGLNDWQHTHGRPSRIGLVHGSLNLSATLLYATSLWCRRNGARGAGQALGFVVDRNHDREPRRLRGAAGDDPIRLCYRPGRRCRSGEQHPSPPEATCSPEHLNRIVARRIGWAGHPVGHNRTRRPPVSGAQDAALRRGDPRGGR